MADTDIRRGIIGTDAVTADETVGNRVVLGPQVDRGFPDADRLVDFVVKRKR